MRNNKGSLVKQAEIAQKLVEIDLKVTGNLVKNR